MTSTASDHSSQTPKMATIHQLRALAVDIKRGVAPVSLGPKALAVLGRLLERPEIVAVNTITQLAQLLDVNASTLSRLARSLGYAGFSEFQRVFRDEVTRGSGRFYSDQALRLFSGSPSDETSDAYVNALVKLSEESVKNIQGCLAQLEASELHRVATALAKARRVRVYGVRQLNAVASVLVYGLSLIRSDVSLLDLPGQGVTENLAHMHNGDVLIVTSVAPYSRSVAQVAELAHGRGPRVIAITDYRASPLVAHADSAFFIPHQSSFISNSIGAYIVFCEGLINLVAKQLGPAALESLQRQEQLIQQLRIEAD